MQRALANDAGLANYRDRFLRVLDCDMTARIYRTIKIDSCQGGDCVKIGWQYLILEHTKRLIGNKQVFRKFSLIDVVTYYT